jgi:hypothetical protein
MYHDWLEWWEGLSRSVVGLFVGTKALASIVVGSSPSVSDAGALSSAEPKGVKGVSRGTTLAVLEQSSSRRVLRTLVLVQRLGSKQALMSRMLFRAIILACLVVEQRPSRCAVRHWDRRAVSVWTVVTLDSRFSNFCQWLSICARCCSLKLIKCLRWV